MQPDHFFMDDIAKFLSGCHGPPVFSAPQKKLTFR